GGSTRRSTSPTRSATLLRSRDAYPTLRHFVNETDLALAIAGHAQEALGPFDRLFLALHLEDREAADHFLRFSERPVPHSDRVSRPPNSESFSRRLASFGGQQHAGVRHVLDQPPHVLHL